MSTSTPTTTRRAEPAHRATTLALPAVPAPRSPVAVHGRRCGCTPCLEALAR